MNGFFKPIKSILPTGLTVITARTERKGLIAGEMSLDVGAAHAAAMDPRWEGLPHFLEHLIANGASKNYGQDEVKKLLRDQFHIDPNAWTNLTETRHFTEVRQGYVFPVRNFWKAFAATADGVFFPKCDKPTMERERIRILEEIEQNLTELRIDNAKFVSLLHGAKWLGLQTLGTREQVASYTAEDCFALHQAYSLRNTRITIVGDIDHQEAIERVSSILADVPAGHAALPKLDVPSMQSGEFRRHKDDVNPGHMDISLLFRSPNIADDNFFASKLAVAELSKIIDDKVKDKFGLYTAHMSQTGWAVDTPEIGLHLITGKKDVASDAVAYALEVLKDPETAARVAQRHHELVEREVTMAEVDQTSLQSLASAFQYINSIGAELLSPEEWIGRFKSTTPEQVQKFIKGISADSPMFLNLRGHKDALDGLPPMETIDSWRASPVERQFSTAGAKAISTPGADPTP